MMSFYRGVEPRAAVTASHTQCLVDTAGTATRLCFSKCSVFYYRVRDVVFRVFVCWVLLMLCALLCTALMVTHH